MFNTETSTNAQVNKNQDLEVLKELLFSMKRIRHVEETIAAKYHEQKMRCPVHLSTGQEAVSAAVGLALRKTDFAVSGHRAHAHYIAKGGSVPKMLAEIYGKETGCCAGKGGSMHLIDQSVGFMGSTAIVGGTIPVGVGLALSSKLKGEDKVTCVFVGDGAIEEGAFYESANFAALKKLPVLFLCENNFYSVYSHLRVRQPSERSIQKMVEGIGIPGFSGDGNNVIEVYHQTLKALKEIRAGNGPRFLEFTTYRWREHCGPNFDNNIGYRTEEEYLHWRAKEPIGAFEAVMVNEGHLSESEVKEMERQINIEVDEAFHFAETSPFPKPEAAYTHLFSE